MSMTTTTQESPPRSGGAVFWITLACVFAVFLAAANRAFLESMGHGAIPALLRVTAALVATALFAKLWQGLGDRRGLKALAFAAALAASAAVALIGQAGSEGPSATPVAAAPAPVPAIAAAPAAAGNVFDQFDPPACPTQHVLTDAGTCAPFYTQRTSSSGCPAGYIDHPADPTLCALPAVAARLMPAH